MGIKKYILILIVVLFILGNQFMSVLADNPIFPTADTYTDGSDPDFTWDLNFGAEQFLQLSASNLAGCVPTTYLWYKFAIPSTTETITTANLSITFGLAGASGNMDVELLGSSNTGWGELDITWRNQPTLDVGQLATALSVPAGETVVFTGSTLASYLNTHKGETVTLVVRANCSGGVSASANRTIASKENQSGSGAKLELFNPTAISLSAFSASSHITSPWMLLLGVGLLVIIVIAAVFLRKRSKVTA